MMSWKIWRIFVLLIHFISRVFFYGLEFFKNCPASCEFLLTKTIFNPNIGQSNGILRHNLVVSKRSTWTVREAFHEVRFLEPFLFRLFGHKGQRVVSTRPQRPPLVGQFCYPKPKLGSWLVARPLIANRVQLLIRQNVRDHKRRSKIRLRPQLGNNLSIPVKIQ